MASYPLVAFFALYAVLVLYCRFAYYRDPTSAFFDPTRAYERGYSLIRQREAEIFIADAAEEPFLRSDNTTTPSLCVGIATVARGGERYFRVSVGALLQGLTEVERQDIHLVAFIAHTDPTVHPAYSERWLRNVADQILTYDDLPPEELERVKVWEGAKGVFREKGLYDYRYLLDACYRVGTPNIMMLEGDVMALDGWYSRTMRALAIAQAQTRKKGLSDYLYLRLFYTEEFLGWNVEEWRTYLFWSFTAMALPLIAMLVARYRYKNLGRTLTNNAIIVVCGVCIPLSVALFFAAGRHSMLPLPAGVNEMPKFGCCAQSLVYPRSKVPQLLEWYAEKRIGFADTLLEELADEKNEIRWALTPSPMQHIGAKSSKTGEPRAKYNMTIPQTLWNFAFELNDSDALRRKRRQQASRYS